ncbi:MAG: TetR/AcrR family transcriptional regulator [Desulfocucumaceae bacterium]
MKNNTTSSRKTRAIETKNKIYKSADQLFRKHGFEKVSVDSIVEMAGVSKGSFYVHFHSKDSLIAALITDLVNNVDLDYKSYLESFVNTAASDILIALAGRIADIITGTIGYDLIKMAYEVQITRTINTEVIWGYNRELYKIFSNIINQGIQQGEFTAELPVDTIANHFIMAIRGLTYEWCIRYPDFNLKDEVLKHFKILLTGIKKQ